MRLLVPVVFGLCVGLPLARSARPRSPLAETVTVAIFDEQSMTFAECAAITEIRRVEPTTYPTRLAKAQAAHVVQGCTLRNVPYGQYRIIRRVKHEVFASFSGYCTIQEAEPVCVINLDVPDVFGHERVTVF